MLSETISQGDSLTRQLGLSRLISEATLVSEGLTRLLAATRGLRD